MTSVTRNLNHDVTHWPVTGSDGFGGFTFGSPVLLKGRWEETAMMFLTLENEEHVSQAVVYSSVPIAIGDFVAFGNLTASSTPLTVVAPDRAYRVRQKHRTTDLRNLTILHKAIL